MSSEHSDTNRSSDDTGADSSNVGDGSQGETPAVSAAAQEDSGSIGPAVGRRTALGGIASTFALSGLSVDSSTVLAAGADDPQPALTDHYDGPHADHADSHHPGAPRFVQVGESIQNPIHVGEYGAFGFRDNIAPRLPDPEPHGESFDADDFEWSLGSAPDGSDAALHFGSSTSEEFPRYDTGTGHTVDFSPDVPGRYVLELDAPDGTHELTVHAFPEGNGPPSRLSLDGNYDDATDEFVIESMARPAPESDAGQSDVAVTFLADDRDDLATDDIEVDGHTARIPADALGGERASVHACAYDGGDRSAMDSVELHADGDVSLPNRPPEWLDDAVFYQIFTRSWAGERGATTMDDLADGAEYLDDLGVDAVWLTPVVPAESVARQLETGELHEKYDYLNGTLSGGGPHGYDTLDYFGISPDLVPEGEDPIEAYQQFVDACHERDIRVVFDIVISHCGRSHPTVQSTIAAQGTSPPHDALEYPAVTEWNDSDRAFEWFARSDTDDSYQGNLVETAPHVTGFFGLRHMPNFNYNSLAVRAHMLAVADFWSGQIGVDGFRCDIAWGVPRSLWSEMREVVRENNSEFLLLDETIPKDYRMSENAFDMHFDTEGFTIGSHSVASGEAEPDRLVDEVRARNNQGVTPHSRIFNLVENHDEQRLLNQTVIDPDSPDHEAVTDEEWDAAAHLQRVCWATGVLLPGIPGVYYGQERQISRYGEGRHLGDDDHRGRQNGGVDPTADVRPGGRQRAFMNWDEYDEEHLTFYRELIDTYHRVDALGPEADLRSAWSFSTDDVIAFGRDASDLEDVSGPDQVVALVNFEATTSEVTVRPGLGDVDLVSGEAVSDQDDTRPGRVLEIEDVLVLEAPELYSVGDLVADFEPPNGTDTGPGSYEYPTGDEYEPGSFDVTGFSVRELPDSYQFRVDLGGELTNPQDREYGLSHQHLQVYLRSPESETGVTDAKAGVNASFEAPYQHVIVANGNDGVRIEDANGDVVASGNLAVNPVVDEFLVDVPKETFDAGIEELELAPLLFGYDGDADGGVMPVEESAGTDSFAGAESETAPNVIDTGLPATFPNAETLAYDQEHTATIPYAAVITEFEQVAEFDLDTGTGYGPGSYEVPTGGDYYEEAWDIDEVAVSESRDSVRFDVTMATEPENPWDFGPGFSHPFFQFYLHVPGASPESSMGRTGTNVAFRDTHHYRVLVHGEGVERVENAAGESVSRNVEVTLDGRTVTIEFPTAAVDWDTDEQGVGIAPTVMPYDGFGDGGIRGIGPEASEHGIGGGTTADIDPAVMDMVVPEGMDRAEILGEYNENDPPRLPFVGLGPMEDIEGVRVELDDESADDDGDDEDDTQESTDDGDDAGDTTTEDDASDDGSPGFGVGAAVSAVGGAAYLLKRRLGSDSKRSD